jgi:hypothetical protein
MWRKVGIQAKLACQSLEKSQKQILHALKSIS